MKKSWLTWLGLGAACAACCAPLIAPLLAGAGVASMGAVGAGFSLFGLSPSETLCVAAIAAGVGALSVFLLRRYRAARRATAAGSYAPSSDGAFCDVDGACAPSGSRGKHGRT